jgi:hypothetical protein
MMELSVIFSFFVEADGNGSVNQDKCCIRLGLVGKWGVFFFLGLTFQAAGIEGDAYSMGPD